MQKTKSGFFRKVASLVLAAAMAVPLITATVSAADPPPNPWNYGTYGDRKLYNLAAEYNNKTAAEKKKLVTDKSVTLVNIAASQVSKDKKAKITYAILTPLAPKFNYVPTGGDDDGDQKYETYTIKGLSETYKISAPQNNKFTKDAYGNPLKPNTPYKFIMILTETRDLTEKVDKIGTDGKPVKDTSGNIEKVPLWSDQDKADIYKYDGKNWVSAGISAAAATADVPQVIGYGVITTDYTKAKVKPALKKVVKAVKDHSKETLTAPFTATSTTITFDPDTILLPAYSAVGTRNIEWSYDNKSWKTLSPKRAGTNGDYYDKNGIMYGYSGETIIDRVLQPNKQYTVYVRYGKNDATGESESAAITYKIKTAPATVVEDTQEKAEGKNPASNAKVRMKLNNSNSQSQNLTDVKICAENNPTLYVTRDDVYNILKGVDDGKDNKTVSKTEWIDEKDADGKATGKKVEKKVDYQIFDTTNNRVDKTGLTAQWKKVTGYDKNGKPVTKPLGKAAAFNSSGYTYYTITSADVGALGIYCEIKVPAIDAKADKTNKDIVCTYTTGKIYLTDNDPVSLSASVDYKGPSTGSWNSINSGTKLTAGDIVRVTTTTNNTAYPGAQVKWELFKVVDGKDEAVAVPDDAVSGHGNESYLKIPSGVDKIKITVAAYNTTNNRESKEFLFSVNNGGTAVPEIPVNPLKTTAQTMLDSFNGSLTAENMAYYEYSDLFLILASVNAYKDSEKDAAKWTEFENTGTAPNTNKEIIAKIEELIPAYEKAVLEKAAKVLADLTDAQEVNADCETPTEEQRIELFQAKVRSLLYNSSLYVTVDTPVKDTGETYTFKLTIGTQSKEGVKVTFKVVTPNELATRTFVSARKTYLDKYTKTQLEAVTNPDSTAQNFINAWYDLSDEVKELVRKEYKPADTDGYATVDELIEALIPKCGWTLVYPTDPNPNT